MSGYRISQVAERTGFSRATLRYYEDIGVVPAPARSQAGYRIYDDRALQRLTLVARAKELGLSLDEIGDLADVWEDDECGPVQQRLAALVAAKLTETRARIIRLAEEADRLQAVASRLHQDPQPGRCDDTCACNAETPAGVVGADERTNRGRDEPPIACTLGPSEVEGRVRDWGRVLELAVDRQRREGGLRLLFPADAGLAGRLAELAQAEQACCAFFTFTVGIAADAVTLDVRAPAHAEHMVTALFGAGA